MKKFMVLLTALAMLLALSACGGDATLSGSGTEADPYRIGSAQDMWTMADLINSKETFDDYYEAHYLITADIDLGGKEWTPIGVYSVGFEGVLDGGGHTVSGIQINYSDPLVGEKQNRFGLIATMKGTVKNLTISDSTITVKSYNSPNVGAVVGYLFSGAVENCHTTDSVKVTSSYYAGGIIGTVNSEAVIQNCSNAAEVTALLNVGAAGGITTNADCQIQFCSNSGTIISEGDAGGIVVAAGDSVMDCTNSGTIQAIGAAGGIVMSFDDGALNKNENDAAVTVARCVNTGNVSSSKKQAGGIAAVARTGSVVDCVNEGAVIASLEAGGVIGVFHISAFGTPSEAFTVSSCANSGAVSAMAEAGNSEAGGILGVIYSCQTHILFENCTNSGTVLSDGEKDVMDTTGECGGILGTGAAAELRFVNCSNSGDVQGVAKAGGIAGKVAPSSKDGTESLFLAENCTNTGAVQAKYHGGLTTMCYSGGIVGYMSQEDDPNGAFAQREFNSCTNSGALTCDKEPFCADDICASDLMAKVFDE